MTEIVCNICGKEESDRDTASIKGWCPSFETPPKAYCPQCIKEWIKKLEEAEADDGE